MKFKVSLKDFQTMTKSEKFFLAKRCLPVVFDFICEGWGLSVANRKAASICNVHPEVIRLLAIRESNLASMAKGIKKLNLTVSPKLYSELIVINNEH